MSVECVVTIYCMLIILNIIYYTITPYCHIYSILSLHDSRYEYRIYCIIYDIMVLKMFIHHSLYDIFDEY